MKAKSSLKEQNYYIYSLITLYELIIKALTSSWDHPPPLARSCGPQKIFGAIPCPIDLFTNLMALTSNPFWLMAWAKQYTIRELHLWHFF